MATHLKRTDVFVGVFAFETVLCSRRRIVATEKEPTMEDRKQPKHRRRWITFGLVVVGGLFLWLLPKERLLLERATVVTKKGDGYADQFYYPGSRSQWLSSNEILFERLEGPKYRTRVLYRQNLQTGQQQKLPELSKIVESFQADAYSYTISPDGKWLLTSTWLQPGYLLSEVNGKHYYKYPSNRVGDACFVFWMYDCRHWLENYTCNGSSCGLFLHDVQSPKVIKKLPLEGNFTLGYTLGYLERVVSLQKAISIVSPEDTGKTKSPLPPAVKACILSLEAGGKVLQEYNIPVPKHSEDFAYYVSPQGDKIAWQITMLLPDRAGEWLQKYLPFLKIQPRDLKRTELWVCNLDGTDMHEIGYLSRPIDQEEREESLPDRLLPDIWWLPDGKRLSFGYDSKLYTVPID